MPSEKVCVPADIESYDNHALLELFMKAVDAEKKPSALHWSSLMGRNREWREEKGLLRLR